MTGSSAALLSREMATALRGRAWEVPIHPFSFEEALRHQADDVAGTPGLLPPGNARQLERAFSHYLDSGGFPEAQGLDIATRRQLLRDYVDVAMLRDVVERHGVTNVAGLRWLVRQLLGNAAGLFSVEKFYAALKSQGLASRRTPSISSSHISKTASSCAPCGSRQVRAAADGQPAQGLPGGSRV